MKEKFYLVRIVVHALYDIRFSMSLP